MTEEEAREGILEALRGIREELKKLNDVISVGDEDEGQEPDPIAEAAAKLKRERNRPR